MVEFVIEVVPIGLSFLAFCISGITFWLTLIRSGTVCMTTPTQIYLGPDGGNAEGIKIYFTALLYATSKRGCVIENMFVRLRYQETQRDFNIWVYDDRTGARLVRGCGLVITDSGISTAHHFLLQKREDFTSLHSGNYTLEIHAKLVGKRGTIKLKEVSLPINEPESQSLKNNKCGIYFDWGSFSEKYISHIDDKMPTRREDMEYFPKQVLAEKK